MKRISILFAAAAMVFAASCQKDNFTSEGQEAVVTFCTTLPGVATKAVADGETANTLYYEVYTVDANGNSEKLVYDGTASVSGKSGSVNVRLIKNKAYNVYFWAQYESEDFTSPYNVEDLTNIGVSYENALANDDRRDAFYTVLKSVAYSGSEAETVTLRRAFAQVNLATEDLALVLSHASRPTTSSIEITNLATSFNTFTGEGTGSVDAVFGTAYIPGLNDANVADYTVETVEDLNNVGADNKSYDYLATAYVLVPAAEGYTSLSSIKATVNFAADNSIELSHSEATIQKNWRTNIYGNLLSGQVTHNISVDQRFEDEDHNFESITGSEQIQLIANTDNVVYLQPGQYTLPDDIKILRSAEVSGSIKFVGAAAGVVIVVEKDKNYLGLPISFHNITLQFAENAGFVASKVESYINCKIEGTPVINGTEASFEGCDLAEAESITVTGGLTLTDCENLNTVIKTEGENASLSIEKEGEVIDLTNAVLVFDGESLVSSLEGGLNVVFANDIYVDPAKLSNAYGKTGVKVRPGQTLNGAGHTLTVRGAGGTWDSGINAYGGTIKNVKLTGSFRGIFMGQTADQVSDLFIENVIIDDVTYTFNSDGVKTDASANYGVYFKNCELSGWTSFSQKHKIVSFENCTFTDKSYRFCRPYNDAIFKNCNFAYNYNLDTAQKLGEITITFENCLYNGEPVSVNSGSELADDNNSDTDPFLYSYAEGQNVIIK